MSAELGMHALLIERSLHLGDGDRGNSVADEICQCTRLGHEATEVDELLQRDGYLGLAQDEVNAVIAHVEAQRRTDPLK